MTRKEEGRARRSHLRKLWRNIHLSLALTVGLFFVLMGLTGSFNAFLVEIEDLLVSRQAGPIQEGAPRPLDEIFEKLQAAYPQRTGRWVLSIPSHGEGLLRAEYPKPEEKRNELYAPLRVWINPYTAEVVAESFWGETLPTLIFEWHATLVLGKSSPEAGQIGIKVVGALGFLLFISVATGLYLWWPRGGKFRQAFTLKRGVSGPRRLFDLHRLSGFYFSAVLLILALSGLYFTYGEYLKSLVALFSPVAQERWKEPQGLKSAVLEGTKSLSIAQVVAIAHGVFPNAQLTQVVTPDGRGGVYGVTMEQPNVILDATPMSTAWIDRYSGQVLAVRDPRTLTAGEILLGFMWILHNGKTMGLPGRILVCLTGFVPLVLYVTGLIRWLQKRRTEKHRKTRLGKNS